MTSPRVALGAIEAVSDSNRAAVIADMTGAQQGDTLIVQADGNLAPGLSVGASGREMIFGHGVSVNDGATGILTWDTSIGPDSLLDLSTPMAPTVKTAGVYAFTIQPCPAPLTVGGQYWLDFQVDIASTDLDVSLVSPPATAAIPSPSCALTAVWYLPAGGEVGVLLTSFDGVGAVVYSLLASVQRIV